MNDKERQQYKKFFAQNLEKLLKERGITRKELAGAVGITETSMNSYCQGRNLPPVDKILKMALMLDCSVVDLISDNLGKGPKAKAVIEDRRIRALLVFSQAGFWIEENGEYITLTEQHKTDFSDGEISLIPPNPIKIHKNSLIPFFDEIVLFALRKDITFKDAVFKIIEVKKG